MICEAITARITARPSTAVATDEAVEMFLAVVKVHRP
jgi:hypothetical protein